MGSRVLSFFTLEHAAVVVVWGGDSLTDGPWSFPQSAGRGSTVCSKCSRKLIYVYNELVVFLKEILARALLDPSGRAFFMG